ncbi:AAA family ATPase [Candidatus Saccharibacteria bacterium]|nr:AAA family ATPase [Candidatus Saccharibacteria bacterium]
MNILITGAPGSGKTAVSEVLGQKGYIVHDADDGFGQWVHKSTGKVHYSRPAANRGGYYWVWRINKVKNLLKEANENIVFFCGIASNQAELFEDFDKIVILNCDFKTIKHRLKNRQNNTFGKRTEDFDWIRRNHDSHMSQLQRGGAIGIDADQPLDKVVDEVIKIAHEC